MTIEITVPGLKFETFEAVNAWINESAFAKVVDFCVEAEDTQAVLGSLKPGKTLDKKDTLRRLGMASETNIVQYLDNRMVARK